MQKLCDFAMQWKMYIWNDSRPHPPQAAAAQYLIIMTEMWLRLRALVLAMTRMSLDE